MGYRVKQTPPPKPEETLPIVSVRNGGTASVAFPCFYLETEKPVDWHDHHHHDYIGWPAPNHPDHICQMLPDYSRPDPNRVFEYVDMDKATPIDLIAEGYTAALVYIDSSDSTGKYQSNLITIDSLIDSDEPWVVRANFKAMLSEFADKPVDFRFTVFAYSPATTIDGFEYPETYDEVARCILSVLPGNRS